MADGMEVSLSNQKPSKIHLSPFANARIALSALCPPHNNRPFSGQGIVPSIKAIIIMDDDGTRITSKYYDAADAESDKQVRSPSLIDCYEPQPARNKKCGTLARSSINRKDSFSRTIVSFSSIAVDSMRRTSPIIGQCQRCVGSD